MLLIFFWVFGVVDIVVVVVVVVATFGFVTVPVPVLIPVAVPVLALGHPRGVVPSEVGGLLPRDVRGSVDVLVAALGVGQDLVGRLGRAHRGLFFRLARPAQAVGVQVALDGKVAVADELVELGVGRRRVVEVLLQLLGGVGLAAVAGAALDHLFGGVGGPLGHRFERLSHLGFFGGLGLGLGAVEGVELRLGRALRLLHALVGRYRLGHRGAPQESLGRGLLPGFCVFAALLGFGRPDDLGLGRRVGVQGRRRLVVEAHAVPPHDGRAPGGRHLLDLAGPPRRELPDRHAPSDDGALHDRLDVVLLPQSDRSLGGELGGGLGGGHVGSALDGRQREHKHARALGPLGAGERDGRGSGVDDVKRAVRAQNRVAAGDGRGRLDALGRGRLLGGKLLLLRLGELVLGELLLGELVLLLGLGRPDEGAARVDHGLPVLQRRDSLINTLGRAVLLEALDGRVQLLERLVHWWRCCGDVVLVLEGPDPF